MLTRASCLCVLARFTVNGSMSLMPTMAFSEFRLSGFASASKRHAPSERSDRALCSGVVPSAPLLGPSGRWATKLDWISRGAPWVRWGGHVPAVEDRAMSSTRCATQGAIYHSRIYRRIVPRCAWIACPYGSGAGENVGALFIEKTRIGLTRDCRKKPQQMA
jgi:hypothetical protein